MNIIYENKRKSESYLPHELNTRYYAVLSYRNGNNLLMFVENIIYLNLLFQDEIESLMKLRNHLLINHINH